MKKRRKILSKSWLLLAVCVLAAAAWFLNAVGNLHTGQRQQGREQLETALRRAAVACYAAEGIYPPDLDYLTDHYGVLIDEDRYAVFYDVFADNLMPDITVLEKNA